jgi:hypothetical protein
MHREHGRMRLVLVAGTVAVLCVACGTKRNEERCLEGLCSDLPFCDIAGEPNACSRPHVTNIDSFHVIDDLTYDEAWANKSYATKRENA